MNKKNREERFSHLDKTGNVRMVDVTEKDKSFRVARAEGSVCMKPETVTALEEGGSPKGDVLATAKIAGIQAAKRTADIIPLCHPLHLTWADVEFRFEKDQVRIESTVKTKEATGVEMEALMAVSAAALTIYDMCKALDKEMVISGIRLVQKRGGMSGHATDYRPRVGIIVLSDSVFAGEKEDRSGTILQAGFKDVGCPADHMLVLPDGSSNLEKTVRTWIDEGVELIVTSGGTGIGPRDKTVDTMEAVFDTRLPGVEQALNARGLSTVKTAMLSRLAAGVVGNALVICLPGSPGAARDAVEVLVPWIFHAYPMMRGEGHPGQE